MATAPNQAPSGANDQAFIAPADLYFDPENPRFMEYESKTEEEIIQYLS